AASGATQTITSPTARILPVGGFDVSMSVELKDNQDFKASCVGTQATYEIQINRSAVGAYRVQITKVKGAVTSSIVPATTYQVPGTAFSLKITKRRTTGGFRMVVQMNDTVIFEGLDGDSEFMVRLQGLTLSASGNADLDDILVADLTKYPE